MITETELKQAVNRFLGWRIPDSFSPDCYITFGRQMALKNHGWPVGTNLFNAVEAEAMLRHVLDVVPDSVKPSAPVYTTAAEAAMIRADEVLPGKAPVEPAKEATPNDLVQALQANTKALQRLNKQLERWDVNGMPQPRVEP